MGPIPGWEPHAGELPALTQGVPLCEQRCGGSTPISQQTGRREAGGHPSALWKRAPTITVGTWQ